MKTGKVAKLIMVSLEENLSYGAIKVSLKDTIAAPKCQNPFPFPIVKHGNSAIRVVGSFQLGLPSKVPQTP